MGSYGSGDVWRQIISRKHPCKSWSCCACCSKSIAESLGKSTVKRRWFAGSFLIVSSTLRTAILSFSYNLMQIRDESSNMTLSMQHGRLWYRGLVISHSCWFNSPSARKWDTPSHFHTWFSRKGNGEPMLTCNSRSNSQAANITVLTPSREAAPFHKQNFSSWV